MSYYTAAMNVGTAASQSVGETGFSTITQNVTGTNNQKILVIWRTAIHDGGSGGNLYSFAASDKINCSTGQIRSVYNGADRHWFCWVTITGSGSYSVTFNEITYAIFGWETIYYNNRQKLVGTTAPDIGTPDISATEILSVHNEGNTPSGGIKFSDLYKGGSYVPNNSVNANIPTSGSISYGDFVNTNKTCANRGDGSDTLENIVITAGIAGSTTSSGGGGGKGGGTTYTFNYRIGYGEANSGYGDSGDLGSITGDGKYRGLGLGSYSTNPDREITAAFVGITGSSTTNNYVTQGTENFRIRFSQRADNATYEGLGGTHTSGSATASNSVANWQQCFWCNVDDNTGQYGMLDIDDATLTNYEHGSNNNYSDLVWTHSGITQMISGETYVLAFLDWDV
jgi:hypothetical protein